MKSTVRSICRSSSSPPKGDDAIHRYLKPGALAQLRNSKIIAKSRRPTSHSFMSLHSLSTASAAAVPATVTPSPAYPSDGIPCLALRTTGGPQCPQRKKLVAGLPF